MTWPTILFEAAFGADPFTASSGWTWRDLASSTYGSRLMGLTITSPTRSRMLDTFAPGTITAVLDNADRDLDPTNLSGTWVSGGLTQIVPNLPIRVRATYSAVTYPLGFGFRDAGGVLWEDPSWSEVTWQATDAFKLLTRAPRTATAAVGADELSGDRIDRILDSAGWNASDRAVAAGLAHMQPTTLDGNALTELQLTADSEGGELWVSPAGAVTFMARDYRLATTTWSFSDASGPSDYLDAELVDDDDVLTNWASVTRVGGTAQIVEDATSQTRYGLTANPRWTRADLMMADDTDAQALGELAVGLYADTVVRFSSLTIDPTTNDNLWAFVFGVRIGDRVAITRTPPGGGSAITRTGFVEGWTIDITGLDGGAQGQWLMRVVLSDASAWSAHADADVWDTGEWDTATWFY